MFNSDYTLEQITKKISEFFIIIFKSRLQICLEYMA